MKIHELNTGTLSSPTYIAVDNGSDTSKLDLAAMMKGKGSSGNPVYSNDSGVLTPINVEGWIKLKIFTGSNIDNLTESGWFYFGSSVSGAPIAEAGFMLSMYYNTNYACQIFIARANAENMWIRNKVAGVWSSWIRYSEAPENATSVWSTPTLSNVMNINSGGYYLEGRRCYVQIYGATRLSLSTGASANLATGMPLPKSASEISLNCSVASKSGNSAIVTSGGILKMYVDADHAIPSGSSVSITGVYTVN